MKLVRSFRMLLNKDWMKFALKKTNPSMYAKAKTIIFGKNTMNTAA